jgi:hypothetical protein
MYLTLTSLTRLLRNAAKALLLLPILAGGISSRAAAETAYIDQASVAFHGTTAFKASAPTTPISVPQYGPHTTAIIPTPEATSPARANGNFAQTVQIGNFNQVFQLQSGSNNFSNVGVIGGIRNNVAVLQSGHNLRSNLMMVNTQGMSISVIEPNGSAPLNMLIARLPNGGLLIKR